MWWAEGTEHKYAKETANSKPTQFVYFESKHKAGHFQYGLLFYVPSRDIGLPCVPFTLHAWHSKRDILLFYARVGIP